MYIIVYMFYESRYGAEVHLKWKVICILYMILKRLQLQLTDQQSSTTGNKITEHILNLITKSILPSSSLTINKTTYFGISILPLSIFLWKTTPMPPTSMVPFIATKAMAPNIAVIWITSVQTTACNPP